MAFFHVAEKLTITKTVKAPSDVNMRLNDKG